MNAVDYPMAMTVGARKRQLCLLVGLLAVNSCVLVIAPLFTDKAGIVPLSGKLAQDFESVAPAWLLGASALVGFWTVFGGGQWYVRLAFSILAWIWLVMMLLVGELATANWPYSLHGHLFDAVVMALASVTVFAAARRFLKWRLLLHGEIAFPGCSDRFQYRLFHLALTFGAIGAALAVARPLNNRFVHFSLADILNPHHVKEWLLYSAPAWCLICIALATIAAMMRTKVWYCIPPLLLLTVLLDAALQDLRWAWTPTIAWEWFAEDYPSLLRRRFFADCALLLSLVCWVGAFKAVGFQLRPIVGRTAERTANAVASPAQ